jgi:hypothetical protein
MPERRATSRGLINEERPELGLSRDTTIQLLLGVPA